MLNVFLKSTINRERMRERERERERETVRERKRECHICHHLKLVTESEEVDDDVTLFTHILCDEDD